MTKRHFCLELWQWASGFKTECAQGRCFPISLSSRVMSSTTPHSSDWCAALMHAARTVDGDGRVQKWPNTWPTRDQHVTNTTQLENQTRLFKSGPELLLCHCIKQLWLAQHKPSHREIWTEGGPTHLGPRIPFKSIHAEFQSGKYDFGTIRPTTSLSTWKALYKINVLLLPWFSRGSRGGHFIFKGAVCVSTVMN